MRWVGGSILGVVSLVFAGCAIALVPDPDSPGDASVGPVHPPPGAADAAPPPPPPPSPVDAGCMVQVLANASFDTTTGTGATKDITPWREGVHNVMPRPYVVAHASELPAGVTPQSGAYVAWLGGGNDVTESFSQLVTVPANTVALRLRGYAWIRTQETNPSHPDRLQLSIWDASGSNTLENIYGLTDRDASGGWQAFSYDCYHTYAGTSIYLQAAVTTDSVNPTDFLLDSLAFEAVVCP